MIFPELLLWLDPVARPGPEAMAVDEWLLETAELPVLRIYRWDGAWGSIGYFGALAAARAALPGLEWVRRWTGGGVVDHRADWTYSLIAPTGSMPSALRKTESYREIHAALAAALLSRGVAAAISAGDSRTGLDLCFRNPVRHDLIGEAGAKIAGAGQRRTKLGLLHQGSLTQGGSCGLAPEFAGRLAKAVSEMEPRVPMDEIAARVARRYADPAWTARR